MVVEALAPALPEKPEALAWPDKARAVKIVDQVSYDLATGMLGDVVALRKSIVDDFAEPKKKAFEAHRAVVAQETRYLQPLQEAEQILKRSIGDFAAEQERLRRAEEERLKQEAIKREQEERLAAAVDAEQSGATAEEVEAVLEVPAFTAAAVIAQPTYSKAQGVSTREVWSAQVVNVRMLCRAVADGVIAENVITPNMTALNGLARSLKSGFQVPGVKAVRTNTVAVR